MAQRHHTGGETPRPRNPISRKRTRRGAITELLEPRQLLSTYTVNTLSDPATPVAGMLSLREAVADANSHTGADTIAFAASLFTTSGQKTITLAQGQINFTDTTGATTVTGPGTAKLAISGNNASRIVTVAAKTTVTLSGLTLTGGKATADSHGNYSGGAVENSGALTISACTLSGNTAANEGNGAGYGGAVDSTGPLTIQNSTFNSNSALGSSTPAGAGQGGAIYSLGTLTISGSTLSNNTATGGGSIDTGGGADGDGGAIYAAAPITVTSSTLSGDSAVGGQGQGNGPPPTYYAGSGEGGAIFASETATLTSTKITGCTATGGTAQYGENGGAAGGAIDAAGNLTLTTCTISNNAITSGDPYEPPSAPATGGGIACTANLKLIQSTVSGNIATGGPSIAAGATGTDALGGGIYVTGQLALSQSTISGNKAQGGIGDFGDLVPPYYASAGGDALGGGIYTRGATTITDSTIANNSAVGGHGGDASEGAPNASSAGNGGNGKAGAIDSNASLQLLDTTISGNVAVAGTGGAGYAGEPPSIPANPAGKPGTATGGGLVIAAGTATLKNSILSADKAGAAQSDIVGSAVSTSANNLIGVGGGLANGVHGNKVGVTSPKLSTLGNNGGPTQTMVPLAGNPAINAGSNSLIPAGLTTDQRGLARIFNTTVDIGADEYTAISITGSVFNDINGDGIRQSGDTGLAGWQVYVDVNDTGVFATGDPTATTNSSGNFTLTVSPTREPMIIREVRQTNWRRTDPAGIYPLGFYSLTPTTPTVTNINFGNSHTALVTGTVFHDVNGNGIQDSGDAGLSDWTIEVDYLNGTTFQDNKYSTTTNSQSVYSLVLAPGEYRIHEVLKSGLHPTKPSTGSVTITLTSGDTVTGENFGDR